MPLIPIVAGVATAANLVIGALGIYATYQSYQANQKTIQYAETYNAEIAKFWDDYYKNTGYRPLYPYKTGSATNEGYLNSLYAANWSAASSMAGGVFNTGQKIHNIYKQR